MANKTKEFDMAIVQSKKAQPTKTNGIYPKKIIVQDGRTPATGEDIIKAVSIYFGCSVKEMQMTSNKERFKLGSFATAYLCWMWTEMSLKEIAALMDYHNHSSVIHGRDVIFDQLEPKTRNKDMQYRIGLVENYLRSKYVRIVRKPFFKY